MNHVNAETLTTGLVESTGTTISPAEESNQW